jgi:hypothetical protein
MLCRRYPLGAAAVISLGWNTSLSFLRERLKMNNTLAVIITVYDVAQQTWYSL